MPIDNADALEALSATLRISLMFNDEGVCDLILNDDETVVTLEGDPHGTTLRFNGVVGDLQDQHSPRALTFLLNANFNGQGTGASSLGLDDVSGEVVLGRVVEVTMLGDGGLEPVVADFANHLLYWRANLARLVDQVAAPGDISFAVSASGGLA